MQTCHTFLYIHHLSLQKLVFLEPIHPLVQAYAERFSSPEDQVLREIAEETAKTYTDSHMLSGHLQGKFLQFFSELIQPASVLEIGTYTGYSTICLSKGLAPGGRVHTIEAKHDHAKAARQNFSMAGTGDKIILHEGNALNIIPQLKETWDLVFIDADKPGYIQYYQLALQQLRTGGYILADNVLFHGQVLENDISGKSALAIQAFNEYVQQDNTVEKLLLTIRDGLLMIKKK